MPNNDKQLSDRPKHLLSHILTWTIASLFAVPFFWYQRSLPLPVFYGEWVAFVLGLIALVAWLAGQKDRFLIPSLAFLPIGLALLIGTQLVVMPDVFSSHARLGMVYLLFSAAVMTALFNSKSIIKIETLATVLLVGALLNCGHDWYLIVIEDAENQIAFGQKNHYADYLTLAIISLCYLYAQKHVGLIVFLLSLLPMIITCAGLPQRSSWFYFIGLAAFTLAKAYKAKHQDALLTRSVLLATTLFVLAAITLPMIIDQQSSLARLMNSGETELGASSRLWIWKSAWGMALAHPWTGIGFGNFDWVYFVTKADFAAGAYWGRVENAHNLFLQLFAELGILAPLTTLIGLAIWLRAQFGQAFDSNNWWLWSCIGIIGIHSLLEYPLWYIYFLAPFAVLLGMSGQSAVEVRLPKSFRLLGCLIIAAAGLASANLLVNYLRLEKFVINLSADERSVDPADLETIARQEPILRPYTWTVKASLARITSANAGEWLPFLRQVNHFEPYPEYVLKQIVSLRLSGNTSGEAIGLAKALAYAFPKQAAKYLADTGTRNAIGPDMASVMKDSLQQR